MIATTLLAAGSARRMLGVDKLLAPIAGEPLLRKLARAALAAGGPVGVTLRVSDAARALVLDGLPVTLLPVPEADEGMAASIRKAALWAKELGAEGLILCPADLPELSGEDFAVLANEFEPAGPPLRLADQDGRAGHPVAFPARFLAALATLRGDKGAASILAEQPCRLIVRAHRGPTLDLDTPEDWERWRNEQA